MDTHHKMIYPDFFPQKLKVKSGESDTSMLPMDQLYQNSEECAS